MVNGRMRVLGLSPSNPANEKSSVSGLAPKSVRTIAFYKLVVLVYFQAA